MVTEAILDAFIISPGSLISSAIDVTIRCPHGCRKQHSTALSASQIAVAARDGELETEQIWGERAAITRGSQWKNWFHKYGQDA